MGEFAKFPGNGMDPILMSSLKDHHIESSIIRCTACWTVLNISDPSDIKQHPDLKTIICAKCFKFYGSGIFSQDEDGDKYCRICAEGGCLIGCDFCKNVFCNKCISQNFGRKERAKIKEADEWKCYVCQKESDENPLKPIMNAASALMDYIERKTKPKAKNGKGMRNSKGRSLDPDSLFDTELESTNDDEKSADQWLQKHFTRVCRSFDSDKRQIMKLKLKLKNHHEVPRRVHRCGAKLESYLKQHIQNCQNIISVLALDNERKKCEIESMPSTCNDTVVIEVEDGNECKSSQSLLEDLVNKTNNDAPLKSSIVEDIQETKVVSENGIAEDDLSDTEVLFTKGKDTSTVEEDEKSSTKYEESTSEEIRNTSNFNEKLSPKSKSGSDNENSDVLKVDKNLLKQKRREKLSLSYRKKYGSPRSKSSGDSTSTTPVKDVDSASEDGEGTSKTPVKDIHSASENDENSLATPVKDINSESENDESRSTPVKDINSASENDESRSTPVRDINSASENDESRSTPFKDLHSASVNDESRSTTPVKDLHSASENDKNVSKNPKKLTNISSKNGTADLNSESLFVSPEQKQQTQEFADDEPIKNWEGVFSSSTPVNSNKSENLFDDDNNDSDTSNNLNLESVIDGLKEHGDESENTHDNLLQRDSVSNIGSTEDAHIKDDKKNKSEISCNLFNSTLEPVSTIADQELASITALKDDIESSSDVEKLEASLTTKDTDEEFSPSGSKLELEESSDAVNLGHIKNNKDDSDGVQTSKLKKKTIKANEIAKKKLTESLLTDSSDFDTNIVKSQEKSMINVSESDCNEVDQDTLSRKKKSPKKPERDSSENKNEQLDKNTKIKSEEKEKFNKPNEKSDAIPDLDMVVEDTTPITDDDTLTMLLSKDVKIKSQAVVNVRKLDSKIISKFEKGEIKFNLNDQEYDSDDDISLLDKKIARLAELPSKIALNGPKRRSLTVKVSPKRKPPVSNSSISKILDSSDSDNESSDHVASITNKEKLEFFDDDMKVSETLNSITKKCLLDDSDNSDESISSLDSGKSVKDKSAMKATKTIKNDKDSDSPDSKSIKNESASDEEVKSSKNNSSDEDFVVKKKRPKYDKLLNLNLDDSSNSGSAVSAKSNSNKNTGVSKSSKKNSKRKTILLSDNSDSASDSSSISSIASLAQENSKKRKPQAKKRKRIKQLSNSSNSDSDVQEVDSDGCTQSTPSGKGRKKIRKIVGEDNLDKATKKAALAEKERRKRVHDRQKYYNVITEGTTENGDLVTTKLVLQVHKESKEELVEIPQEVLERLKPHQVNGVKFMWECVIESVEQLKDKKGSGCVLAHCMGLGKTLQCIAFLVTLLKNEHINKYIKRAMIVCPYNTVLNWANEFKIWLKSKELKINVYEMTNAKTHYDRADLLEKWHRKGGALILSYETFRNLTQEKSRARIPKKVKERYLNCLVDPGPDIVICDEGHILKNATSAIAKAMSKIRTGRRIVLTGTPLQNNLKEYHTMVHFVKPHLVGTEKEFKNRFVNPINNGQCADSTPQDVKVMKKRVHILHKLLEGCVQRCDYGHVSKFLPPKHEYVLSIKLTEKQIALYSHYMNNYAMNRNNGTVIANGTQLFKDFAILRLIWTHPLLMKMQQKRVDQKALKEELNDDGSSIGSFIDDRSDPSESESESSEDDVKDKDPKPSTSKSNKKRTSESESDGNSSTEEVISKWTSKKRSAQKSDESEPEEEKATLWWQKIAPEDEINKLELSGKMLLLFEILKECSAIGDKVLIFSQSLLTLDLIEELLSVEDTKTQEFSNVIDETIINGSGEDQTNASKIDLDAIGSWVQGLDYFRMDGSTSADLRKRWIEIFNDNANERARVFLISTKAGSLGTNLIGANRVILMDASWNPTHDVQAIFRVYRFGQIKPVYIYRFLAQGTMEEKIYDRQVTKQSLSCRVIDEQQIERHFNAADLAELYSFSPESTSKRPTPIMPKDRLLADMLFRHKGLIVSYHEHDSLLQNLTDEDLTEEERKAAWQEYENEREGINQITNEFGYQAAGPLPAPENIIAGIRAKYPTMDDTTILKIFINYIAQAQKKKQEAVQRAQMFFQAQQSIPVEVANEINRYNVYVGNLEEYSKRFRDQINQRIRHSQFQQANQYQQEQIRQARFQAAQAQFQARFTAQQFQQAFMQNRMQRPTFANQAPRFNQNLGNNQQNVGSSYAGRNYSRANENPARTGLSAAGNADTINNISKLLSDLQKRNINVGNVIVETPGKTSTRSQPKRGGPVITEVIDDHSSFNVQNDNNPVITEVD